ncbi:cytochrome c/c1 heme-lyase [Xylaria bambusicola]|uniref:cytochrome c/c1 heme-lyase n=1 Tax=Xylaria bambusicola TaxID=326684 RepID=UPI002007405C|nr:cytochrome c/c1 heme-lyase [Xylaria bambusicola]KAI0502870.1 cytochrome c/c1 heme-lyase [Xylaria bambusicola]
MLHDIIDQIFLSHHQHHHDDDHHHNSSAPSIPANIMAAADPKQHEQATCPVDHKSREAWLEKAKAASAATDSPPASLPPSHPPVGTNATTNAESCPVDHSAREVWLQQARASSTSENTGIPRHTTPSTSSISSSWSSYIPRIPFFSSSTTTTTTTSNQVPPSTIQSHSPLGIDREVSTIPRTSILPGNDTHSSGASDHPAPPLANNEQETGADRATGNWIYPSERMFFDAMKRKGHDPRAADMRTVVPIHNAVNERAWAEIKAWEGPWIQGSSCSGPRLHSFSGLSTQMSPKARFNTLLGYQAPFDRHDWVVDRCGKEVEYVIDFYAGRNTGNGADGKLSFYLDVRPKLNSWEGVKMRAFRAAGLA